MDFLAKAQDFAKSPQGIAAVGAINSKMGGEAGAPAAEGAAKAAPLSPEGFLAEAQSFAKTPQGMMLQGAMMSKLGLPGGNETAMTGAALSALGGGGKGAETALAGAALSALGGGAKGGESGLAGAALSALGGGGAQTEAAKVEGVAAEAVKTDVGAAANPTAGAPAVPAGLMGEATQFAQSAAGKSLLAEAQKSLCMSIEVFLSFSRKSN